MHWWNVAQEPSGSPPFRLFHHPISPPSSSSLSLHLCLYCPLSNLIIHALYPPPLSLSLFLSVFLCFALMSPSPAGCCGQTSRSDLHPLPCLPLFLCLSFPPSIDSTFPVLRRYSQISVSACLARFIFVISSCCFSYKPRN